MAEGDLIYDAIRIKRADQVLDIGANADSNITRLSAFIDKLNNILSQANSDAYSQIDRDSIIAEKARIKTAILALHDSII